MEAWWRSPPSMQRQVNGNCKASRVGSTSPPRAQGKQEGSQEPVWSEESQSKHRCHQSCAQHCKTGASSKASPAASMRSIGDVVAPISQDIGDLCEVSVELVLRVAERVQELPEEPLHEATSAGITILLVRKRRHAPPTATAPVGVVPQAVAEEGREAASRGTWAGACRNE